MLERLFLAALPLLGAYLFLRLRYFRLKQYAHIPQLKPSLVWGHMKAVHEYALRLQADSHIDPAFAAMSDDLGNPPLFLVDLRPVNHAMAIVTSHEVAEQFSRASKLFPWSVPKSPTINSFVHLVGRNSILTREGEDWKQLRKRFNPGFAPQHLMTLLPCILDKTWLFLEHLDSYARTGDAFLLDVLTTNLTFDIIGAVVMDTDFDAQHQHRARQGEFIQLFGELVSSYGNDSVNLPWWASPRREFRRYRIASRLDRLLASIIRQKHAAQQSPSAPKSRSILSLALRDTTDLTDQMVKDTGDQIKTFLFAGHDTTAIVLAWAIYELSRTPRALSAVRAELDEVFGSDPDPASIRDQLLSPDGDDKIRRLSYTSAVIKETLRLYPPAASARMSPAGSGFTVRTPQGETICVDGLVIYNCSSLIQRDRAVYGESADDFVPERWLGDTNTSEESETQEAHAAADEKGGHAKIPPSAWRPFERGPRNCIGQELANIEARVILATVARRYDFVKVGVGENALDERGLPVVDEKGQYKVTSELYNVSGNGIVFEL
ncbi:cytochrome P450 [Podospora appendiculata]|uniref:Cytochrome P450 n=1 Tax=Podospora appendiculata TaxID=314037 RepID=A0AAE1CB29_9PEZI|nr:cytochrome P450 [Podospora appendiculata]